MSSLKDMEELISDVVDIELKEYMREALTCYMTGAYRACIVLSFIAIFEDLFKKLSGMAAINKTAKDIFKEISKKREEQKVYENDLLNKLKVGKIITEIDAEFLTVLRTLRNKAAHPSGHKPTAEEARYVYSETICRFLSKPVLSTTQIVDQILSKLTNLYLFPTSNIKDYATIVNEGVKNLHHDSYSYLLNKLIESLENTNEQIKINAGKYLIGLSVKPLNNDVLEQIKKQIVVECSVDGSKRQILMECISTNSSLLNGLDCIVYSRLNKMLEHTISSTKSSDQHKYLKHPIQIARSVLELGEEIVDNYFNSSITQILEKYKLSPVLMKYVKKHNWTKQKVIQLIFEQAGSTSYSEANSFALNANLYDKDISDLMDNINCFELIVRIINACCYGAYGAKNMLAGKFNSIPKIKEKTVKALHDDIISCKEIIEKLGYDDFEIKDFEKNYL